MENGNFFKQIHEIEKINSAIQKTSTEHLFYKCIHATLKPLKTLSGLGNPVILNSNKNEMPWDVSQ